MPSAARTWKRPARRKPTTTRRPAGTAGRRRFWILQGCGRRGAARRASRARADAVPAGPPARRPARPRRPGRARGRLSSAAGLDAGGQRAPAPGRPARPDCRDARRGRAAWRDRTALAPLPRNPRLWAARGRRGGRFYGRSGRHSGLLRRKHGPDRAAASKSSHADRALGNDPRERAGAALGRAHPDAGSKESGIFDTTFRLARPCPERRGARRRIDLAAFSCLRQAVPPPAPWRCRIAPACPCRGRGPPQRGIPARDSSPLPRPGPAAGRPARRRPDAGAAIRAQLPPLRPAHPARRLPAGLPQAAADRDPPRPTGCGHSGRRRSGLRPRRGPDPRRDRPGPDLKSF